MDTAGDIREMYLDLFKGPGADFLNFLQLFEVENHIFYIV